MCERARASGPLGLHRFTPTRIRPPEPKVRGSNPLRDIADRRTSRHALLSRAIERGNYRVCFENATWPAGSKVRFGPLHVKLT